MNRFLQSRAEVDIATKYLQDNGYLESGLSCKNWEIATLLEHLGDGNLIDLGSDGSVVLPNALNKKIVGLKVGLDIAYADDVVSPSKEYDLVKCDLMNTPFPDGFFNTITCLSVIEHQVSFAKLAKECSRLLSNGGKVFISCDYWEPRPDTSKMKLYSLDWNILNKNDLIELIVRFAECGLAMTSVIDWTLGDAVINDKFCSPAKDISYTFGIFSFVKANI